MHGLNRPVTRQLPPAAERRPSFSVQHGVELVDEYAWLRAANWQDVMRDPSVLDPQIRAYLDAENAYTQAALDDTSALQTSLFAEMKARIKEDDSSVPTPDGPFEYFVSHVTGGQYPRLNRRPRGGGPEQVLIDGNKEAEGKPYWQLGSPRRTAPTTAIWPTRRRQGFGAVHHSHPRHGDRRGPARLPSPIRAALSCGPATTARCSTSVSTTTIARCSSTGTSSARQRRRTCWSTRKRTSASMSASARRNRAGSSSSMPTTTRPMRPI